MKKGDKVKTVYGKIETVMKVEEKRIYTYENLTGWYHPTKVFPVCRSVNRYEIAGTGKR